MLLAPVVLFEVAYQVALAFDRHPRTAIVGWREPNERFAMADWAAREGSCDLEVEPLWFATFARGMSRPLMPVRGGWSTADRAVLLLHPGGAAHHGLERLADTIWLSRHATGRDLESVIEERAWFGPHLVGLEAAAWRYFRKEPADLDWSEAALLVGAAKSPNRIPLNADHWAVQRSYVLRALERCNAITAVERWTAEVEPVPNLVSADRR